jgi:hypothetical protein
MKLRIQVHRIQQWPLTSRRDPRVADAQIDSNPDPQIRSL